MSTFQISSKQHLKAVATDARRRHMSLRDHAKGIKAWRDSKDKDHQSRLAEVEDATLRNGFDVEYYSKRPAKLAEYMSKHHEGYEQELIQLTVYARSLKQARIDLLNPIKILSVAGFREPEKTATYLNLLKHVTGSAALHDLRQRAVAERDFSLAWALMTHVSAMPQQHRPFNPEKELAEPLFAEELKETKELLDGIENNCILALQADTEATGKSHSEELLSFGLRKQREAFDNAESLDVFSRDSKTAGDNESNDGSEDYHRYGTTLFRNLTPEQKEEVRKERLTKLGFEPGESAESSVSKIGQGLKQQAASHG